MSHLLGYARVSTIDQDPALQLDALTAAGCQRIYTDRASGTLTARPQLDLLLDHALAGDTVCVWRLDRHVSRPSLYDHLRSPAHQR